MTLIEQIHKRCIVTRRARVLCECLAPLFPVGATVLDIGCGDGQVAWLINQARPDLQFSGVDVLAREKSWIPIELFDGQCLNYADCAFDAVMLVDVLHHTDVPLALLREAARVARGNIVLKDHLREGFLATPTLRFMDWVGNRRHGVTLPYHYWNRRQWSDAFESLDLDLEYCTDQLQLYGWPGRLLFDRSLHFVARLSLQSHAAHAI